MRKPPFFALAAIVVACGSSSERVTFEPDAPPIVPPSETPSLGEEPGKDCTGLRCNIPTCPAGQTTAIEGDTWDPAGKMKLYNVLAYVPNAPLEPFTSSATCDRCGKVSGDPIATALSNEAGHFRLENVPAGKNVPLVVQVGKWRRTITVPLIEPCTTTKLSPKAARLPGKRSEGDMPRIAIVTGSFDELGCLLRRIGVADEEYTSAPNDGRIHVYRGVGGGDLSSGKAKAASELWSSKEKLASYDAVMLACEGWEHDETKDWGYNKTPADKQAMHDYLAAGGRVFATHYHYAWFKKSPAQDFRDIATWNEPASAYGHHELTVDTTFPKGAAFATWLTNVGASTSAGKLEVDNIGANVASVNALVARRWLYGEKGVVYTSFNTPIGVPEDQKCGRAVLTDIHVSGEQGSKALPSACATTALTPQEQALEFLLFDLTACVSPDAKKPEPPMPK